MRAGIGTYILVIVLVLLLFGLISVGDVLSAVFYIIMGIVLLIIIGLLVFRYRMNRLRRDMEQRGEQYRTYTWGSGTRSARREKRDGEVTVQQTGSSRKKVVSNQVGDYVEYEEIREEDNSAN